jgi:hypothetical protein
VHEGDTLRMHICCEIPQWGEPRCAAKPPVVTFETSSPAFLGPLCTVELSLKARDQDTIVSKSLRVFATLPDCAPQPSIVFHQC